MDSLAPLTAILEYGDGMSVNEVKEASSTAVELLGNANARISRLRRDELVSSINKNLVPLVQEDSEFADASPNLFGPAFSKRAKEYLDQIKTLKATLPPRHQTSGEQQYRKPFFRKGLPSGRGMARGRGGGPSHSSRRGSHGERLPR